jgi:hypothetical protein
MDVEALKALMKSDPAAAGSELARIKATFPSGAKDGWTRWHNANNIRSSSITDCLRAAGLRKPAQPKAAPAQAVVLTPAGELHEATLGFKAMMTKAEADPDVARAEKRRTVAFQHFAFLLSKSTLPELMQMTPDQIVSLLRKL